VKLDSLDGFEDAELRAVIARAEELLKEHDTQRKDKALAEVRATLAAVGLSLKDLKSRKPARSPSYHSGHVYQHPANKALTWNGKGKKPGWLVALEVDGKMPLEAANDNVPAAVKKAG
jgi:DNA-binding protein H-NS